MIVSCIKRLRGTTGYYEVNRGTTRYYEVLRRTMRYYEVLRGITRYYEVLRLTRRYYYVLRGTTRYYYVLRGTTKYSEVLLRTTTYQFVLRCATSYYEVLLRITIRCTTSRHGLHCDFLWSRLAGGPSSFFGPGATQKLGGSSVEARPPFGDHWHFWGSRVSWGSVVRLKSAPRN